MDYQGNSNKSKEPKPEKNIERVVTSEVLIQKKTLGQKFKDLFIEADVKSVVRYVIYEVVLPAARNTIVDASSKGIERMMYGENAARARSYGYGYGTQQRVTYNSPISRAFNPMQARRPPSLRPTSQEKNSRDNLIFTTREEAALVLERMNDIIDTYEIVSVSDLNDLVGIRPSYTDNRWGWVYLGDVQIRQVREGFLLDLPPAEPIQ